MRLKANAKINLTLDIVGKRDDGYHLIDSVFQSVSLCDDINVDKCEGVVVRCNDNTINHEANIAYMAAEKFFEQTGISGGAEIVIKKNIPLASGMGGGSADAAAVILALDKLYKTNLGINDLCKIGLAVGADVPFCLTGGTVRVGGIGEALQKLTDMPNCYMLIIKHGKKLSTGDMYKKLDANPCNTRSTQAVVDAIASGDLMGICKNTSNAFLSVCNDSGLISDIKKTNPMAVSLSGSGPTVFAIYKEEGEATTALKALEFMGYNPIFSTPMSSGIIFE